MTVVNLLYKGQLLRNSYAILDLLDRHQEIVPLIAVATLPRSDPSCR